MIAQNLVIPGVSPECVQHCPNIAFGANEAEKEDMDAQTVVAAVCFAIGAADCDQPGYSFDEAGEGRRCQAPSRNNMSEEMVSVTIRGAQEILAAGPDAFDRSMRGIES